MEQIREALDSGVDPNSEGELGLTLLMIAAMNHRVEVVDLLLATDGIEVNKGRGAYTALHLACKEGNGAIISKLIAAPGIDINALDFFKCTPIMTALDYGGTEAVRLMAATADLDCKFPPDGQSLEERCHHRSAKNLIKI